MTRSTPLRSLVDLAVDVGPAVDGDGAQPDASGQRARARRAPARRAPGSGAARGPAAGPGGWPAPAGLGLPGRLGPLEQRHAEGEGLARAGLGLAADVAAGQGVGDGQRLNWKSADDSFIGQRFGEFLGDAEGLEGPRRLVGVVPRGRHRPVGADSGMRAGKASTDMDPLSLLCGGTVRRPEEWSSAPTHRPLPVVAPLLYQPRAVCRGPCAKVSRLTHRRPEGGDDDGQTRGGRHRPRVHPA